MVCSNIRGYGAVPYKFGGSRQTGIKLLENYISPFANKFKAAVTSSWLPRLKYFLFICKVIVYLFYHFIAVNAVNFARFLNAFSP